MINNIKNIFAAFFVITLFLISNIVSANNNTDIKSINQSIEQNKKDIQSLQNSLSVYKEKTDSKLDITTNITKETRRDQLNYKIEKDLLKSAYSSNIETINIVITLVLGVIGVTGYLGIRNINSIKIEFKNELNELINSRRKYESKFNDLFSKLDSIEQKNSEQDSRLQILEIQEKVLSYIRNKNYNRALDYISAGLSMDDNEITLIGLKSYCLMKQNKLSEAIIAIERAIELDPSDMMYASNGCELYALTNDKQRFDELYIKNRSNLLSIYSKNLEFYFNAIFMVHEDKFDNLKKYIVESIEPLPEGKGKHISSNWTSDEVDIVFNIPNNSRSSKLMIHYAKFLTGELSKEALLKIINKT